MLVTQTAAFRLSAVSSCGRQAAEAVSFPCDPPGGINWIDRASIAKACARPDPCFSAPCRAGGMVYVSASRWGCGRQPFGLCANLRLCDESTDSQAVLPNAVQTRVNQLKNIALGRPRWRQNIPTGRSVWPDSGARACHPQTFPQDRGVSGSDLPGPSSFVKTDLAPSPRTRPRPPGRAR